MKKIFLILALSSIYWWDSVTCQLDPADYDFEGDPLVEDFFVKKECEYECIFNGLFVHAERLKKFPTSCNKVCSYLEITVYCNATEEELTVVFANMKTLVGSLSVSRTNYTSMKFLAGLETIETDSTGIGIFLNPRMTELGLSNLTSITAPTLALVRNVNMTRLNVPKLKNLAPYTHYSPEMTVLINNQSPNLCVTTDEMEQFLKKSFPGNISFDGKYCDPIPGQQLCTSPTDGCTKIFGNVLIGREPGWELDMLKSVEIIFGGLHIYSGNFSNFDFLPNLKFIANLDTVKPGLFINGNTNLINTTFPALKKIVTSATISIIISNCSETFLTNPTICIGLAKLEGEPSKFGPLIDEQNCEQIKKAAKNLTGWIEITEDNSGNYYTLTGSLIMMTTATLFLSL